MNGTKERIVELEQELEPLKKQIGDLQDFRVARVSRDQISELVARKRAIEAELSRLRYELTQQT